MSYGAHLWLYATLLFGIIVIPGMDMLLVLANALTGGRRAGMATTAGIMLGGATHTVIAAVGVTLAAKLVPALLTVVLYAGAAYMAWIGLTLVRSSLTVGAVGAARVASLWTAFRQGVVTCLLNPKAYVFTFAVYPQFLLPQYGAIWVQALVMGTLTVLMQFSIYGSVAVAAGRSRDFLVARPGTIRFIGRAAGLVFVLVALTTVWRTAVGMP